ncbi:MAG: nicotinate-nucleotide--dimethylbenzimidazole phosphoribosyltransferase [Fretibacterium sp.]|nr:nicotinate-nucleotide--dimethylbenzimidazole phosphoribosyltransferase [Fretibacterium sp.]
MSRGITIEEAVGRVRPLDERAARAARERQDGLLKPRGSLGELEALSIRIAGITGQVKNTLTRKVHLLFGSDHGICDEGVSGSPQYFTRVLMELYAASGNPADGQCGINVLCRHAGVALRLYDLGVKGLGPRPGIDSSHKLMPEGTANFARTRAMPPETARAAVELGVRLVEEAREEGYQMIGAGEVGMGNTAPAAACIMAALNRPDPALVGRGGGLTDEAFANKKRVIVEALRLHHPDPDAPLDILSCVGGLDIAAMTGVFLGAAAYRLPVVIDGVISIAAALLALRLVPGAKEFMIASHRSAEPAYTAAAETMGLTPLMTLGMRLGEGTGCPIAMQLVDDALAVMNEMGTFAGASLESEYREELRA